MDTPSTCRTAAEAPPPEVGPDVQEETFFPRRHGRHDLRDERELCRSPGHRPLGRSGASPPSQVPQLYCIQLGLQYPKNSKI